MPDFFIRDRKKIEYYCEGWGGLMPDFFMRNYGNRRKNRNWGVIPKFLVCTRRILLRVVGGGAYARFFMRNRKKIRNCGLYPNFWCVLKEYYFECGGGGLCQLFLCVLENY